jgi:hypothetical protein
MTSLRQAAEALLAELQIWCPPELKPAALALRDALAAPQPGREEVRGKLKELMRASFGLCNVGDRVEVARRDCDRLIDELLELAAPQPGRAGCKLAEAWGVVPCPDRDAPQPGRLEVRRKLEELWREGRMAKPLASLDGMEILHRDRLIAELLDAWPQRCEDDLR